MVFIYRFNCTCITIYNVVIEGPTENLLYTSYSTQPTPLVNYIGGIMVSVLILSAVECGFEPQSAQTKDFKIGICCFSVKHAALRRKSIDWLAWNQNNVSEWSDMSTHGLLFQ